MRAPTPCVRSLTVAARQTGRPSQPPRRPIGRCFRPGPPPVPRSDKPAPGHYPPAPGDRTVDPGDRRLKPGDRPPGPGITASAPGNTPSVPGNRTPVPKPQRPVPRDHAPVPGGRGPVPGHGCGNHAETRSNQPGEQRNDPPGGADPLLDLLAAVLAGPADPVPLQREVFAAMRATAGPARAEQQEEANKVDAQRQNTGHLIQRHAQDDRAEGQKEKHPRLVNLVLLHCSAESAT